MLEGRRYDTFEKMNLDFYHRLVDRLQHLVPTPYIVVPAEAGTQERQTLAIAALGPRLRGGDGGGGRNHLFGSHH